MGHPRELPIPHPAPGDANARELVRVWDSGGTQPVSLSPLLWEDPGIWGIVLADLAQLIAEAYGKSGQMNSAAALARIKGGFDAEWEFATDAPKGGMPGSLLGKRP
jgi:hypothetical protein